MKQFPEDDVGDGGEDDVDVPGVGGAGVVDVRRSLDVAGRQEPALDVVQGVVVGRLQTDVVVSKYMIF